MSEIEYTGPTITHQAIEYLPHPYKTGEKITRCWSKWTNGDVTHSDTETVWCTGPGGFEMAMFRPITFGHVLNLAPPPGLKWVDTVALRNDIEAKRSEGNAV